MRSALVAIAVAGLLHAHDPISTSLTWTREISRIFYSRCVTCHSNNLKPAKAPMPLASYSDVRPWAKAIKDEVLSRRMPPWGAVKGFGDFQNDLSLSQDEIMRIAAWVEGGAPEGNPAYLPQPTRDGIKVPPVRGKRVRRIAPPAKLLGIHPIRSVSDLQIVASLPDGSTVPLLWLNDYNAAWNRTFVFREPVTLPAGAKIRTPQGYPVEFLIAP